MREFGTSSLKDLLLGVDVLSELLLSKPKEHILSMMEEVIHEYSSLYWGINISEYSSFILNVFWLKRLKSNSLVCLKELDILNVETVNVISCLNTTNLYLNISIMVLYESKKTLSEDNMCRTIELIEYLGDNKNTAMMLQAQRLGIKLDLKK